MTPIFKRKGSFWLMISEVATHVYMALSLVKQNIWQKVDDRAKLLTHSMVIRKPKERRGTAILFASVSHRLTEHDLFKDPSIPRNAKLPTHGL